MCVCGVCGCVTRQMHNNAANMEILNPIARQRRTTSSESVPQNATELENKINNCVRFDAKADLLLPFIVCEQEVIKIWLRFAYFARTLMLGGNAVHMLWIR